MPVPTTMRAMEVSAPGLKNMHLVSTRSVPWPAPSTDSKDVLVKIEYTALNPVDWKMLEYNFVPLEWPAVVGCDMSGTVAAVPDGSPWKIGDRVWAYSDLGKPYSGSFAEYVRVPGDVLSPVPDGVAMDAASTLGVCTITAAIGLFTHMKLSYEPAAEHSGTTVLVYGASSVVGIYGVGLLKIAGYRMVAVASAKHHAWLKETCGADECWDYKEDGWVDAAASANPGMKYALDCISGPATALCDEILQKCGGKGAMIATVMPGSYPDIKAAVYGINTALSYVELRDDAIKYVKHVTEQLAAGKLSLAPTEMLEGLEAVAEGLQMLQEGKVSGKKVVVKI
eukprot:jgi/Ulvmu1/9035/UM005_0127.1